MIFYFSPTLGPVTITCITMNYKIEVANEIHLVDFKCTFFYYFIFSLSLENKFY